MNTDAQNFLETLLWVADSPDNDERPLEGATIHQFSPAFVEGVETFIRGFREFLEARNFDLDRLDELERSFGGSIYFSQSGHGCGFKDERGDIGDELHALLVEYSGQRYRFEGLDYSLDITDGVIDLSILPEFIDIERAKLFTV